MATLIQPKAETTREGGEQMSNNEVFKNEQIRRDNLSEPEYDLSELDIEEHPEDLEDGEDYHW